MKRYFYWYSAFRRLIFKKDSYLYTSGWIKSLISGHPCDASGEPVPWMNYAVINFLQDRLNNKISLFEYGAGFSTLFYSKLVNDVTSVEYDKLWYEKILSDSPSNACILYRSLDNLNEYTNAIVEFDKVYNVVVIDGRDRVNCAQKAFNCLSDDGVVIFDDSSRKKYQLIFPHALGLGFKMLSFEGFKPGGSKNHKTTIFYRSNNCLGL